ncbi:hypothetical protein [Herbiconiux daphne]|uniref:Uncharacterized protein n=1 Tax=Herbiconiux daphne TaxID=2970914 RepID=A0ABT2H7R0_9MICO|nr:hypothetical protein [Herbiconiux daphne]MCS5735908.1 hypothetical protein [Herbiconiux daphne]
MSAEFWTDDVAALAISTPISEIRIDEFPTGNLRRLQNVLDEMHSDPETATAEFERRYWMLRRLLDS